MYRSKIVYTNNAGPCAKGYGDLFQDIKMTPCSEDGAGTLIGLRMREPRELLELLEQEV